MKTVKKKKKILFKPFYCNLLNEFHNYSKYFHSIKNDYRFGEFRNEAIH